MNNVIDIAEIFAKREIACLLDLTKDEAVMFYDSMKAGKTLAETLREIGVIYRFQVEDWHKLRGWRDTYFPDNVKYKITEKP